MFAVTRLGLRVSRSRVFAPRNAPILGRVRNIRYLSVQSSGDIKDPKPSDDDDDTLESYHDDQELDMDEYSQGGMGEEFDEEKGDLYTTESYEDDNFDPDSGPIVYHPYLEISEEERAKLADEVSALRIDFIKEVIKESKSPKLTVYGSYGLTLAKNLEMPEIIRIAKLLQIPVRVSIYDVSAVQVQLQEPSQWRKLMNPEDLKEADTWDADDRGGEFPDYGSGGEPGVYDGTSNYDDDIYNDDGDFSDWDPEDDFPSSSPGKKNTTAQSDTKPKPKTTKTPKAKKSKSKKAAKNKKAAKKK